MNMRTGKLISKEEYDKLPEHEKPYFIVLEEPGSDLHENEANRHLRRKIQAMERKIKTKIALKCS